MDNSILNSLLEVNKDDMLKAIYEHRENEDDIITPEFKEELRVAQERKKYRYNRFEEEIKKHVNNEKKLIK